MGLEQRRPVNISRQFAMLSVVWDWNRSAQAYFTNLESRDATMAAMDGFPVSFVKWVTSAPTIMLGVVSSRGDGLLLTTVHRPPSFWLIFKQTLPRYRGFGS